jgi:hypothetical protein
MNEPNQTVDVVNPAQGRATAWWSVRPKLQGILLAEVLMVVALLVADETSAEIMKAWFRPMFVTITIEHAHAGITVMAIASLVAVMIEAARTGKLSPRRGDGELKVASATSA